MSGIIQTLFTARPQIHYVGASSISNTGGSNVNINTNNNTKVGDLIIAIGCAFSIGTTWSNSSSFTETQDANGRYIAYKIATAAGSNSSTFTKSSAEDSTFVLLTFRCAKYEATGSQGANSNSSSAGSITVDVTSSLSILFASTNGQPGVTYTFPAGYTSIVSYNASPPSLGIATKVVNIGSTGTQSVTASGGNNCRATQLVINPA